MYPDIIWKIWTPQGHALECRGLKISLNKSAFIKWNFEAPAPPGMTLREVKFLFDTWVPITITYIMNFGIQATILASSTNLSNIYSNT